MAADHEEIWHEFRDRVNMTKTELSHWLESEESQEVGQFKGSDESTGHQVGRHIVDILSKHKADLTDDDYAHMQKVNGYIGRHRAQHPDGDTTHSRWRYSLMNWGHDPEK
jgi:hypothetical protein